MVISIHTYLLIYRHGLQLFHHFLSLGQEEGEEEGSLPQDLFLMDLFLDLLIYRDGLQLFHLFLSLRQEEGEGEQLPGSLPQDLFFLMILFLDLLIYRHWLQLFYLFLSL
jgi:hypothetical protein